MRPNSKDSEVLLDSLSFHFLPLFKKMKSLSRNLIFFPFIMSKKFQCFPFMYVNCYQEYVPQHSGVAPKQSWEMDQQL